MRPLLRILLMALQTATGTLSTGTGGIGTTFGVTGLAFRPKVVIFLWSGRTATGQAEGNHQFGMGYMVGLADRGAAESQCQHNVSPMNNSNATYDNACIVTHTTGGVLEGSADFSSLNSDGFTCIVDAVFAASYLIHYIAIGGSDLQFAASVSVTAPAGAGNQDTTTVTFQPDCAIAFGPSAGALNTIGSDSNWQFGVAAGAAPLCYVLGGSSDDSVTPTVTASYCKSGEFFARVSNGGVTVDDRATLTAWLSNGFRLNWIESANAGNVWRVLCLKGGRYAVGDILTSTSVQAITETGLAFVPTGLILASHNKVESTADTAQAQDERSVGFAIDGTSEGAASILDKNAVTPSDIGVSDQTNQVYINQSTAATIVHEGLADVTSLDAGGFTLQQNDADPVQSFAWYLAMGDAAPPARSASQLSWQQRMP